MFSNLVIIVFLKLPGALASIPQPLKLELLVLPTEGSSLIWITLRTPGQPCLKLSRPSGFRASVRGPAGLMERAMRWTLMSLCLMIPMLEHHRPWWQVSPTPQSSKWTTQIFSLTSASRKSLLKVNIFQLPNSIAQVDLLFY